MKILQNRTNNIIEWYIDIELSEVQAYNNISIAAGTILNFDDDDCQAFLQGIIDNFELNDFEYMGIEKSPRSDSHYMEFMKFSSDKSTLDVYVYVRISNHGMKVRTKSGKYFDKSKVQKKYYAKKAEEIAKDYDNTEPPAVVPIYITFNDKKYTSYMQALFAIIRRIREINKNLSVEDA